MREYTLSTSQVARRLNTHPRTVARLVLSEVLTGIRVRRNFRVSEEDLQDYVAGSRVIPSQEVSEEFVSAVADFEHQKAEHYCEDKNT